jgi:hypothetical protein
MITSQRSPTLGPPVTRHFEPTRIHKQSVEHAYKILIPVASRRSGRPRLRPDDANAEAAIQGLRSTAEGA